MRTYILPLRVDVWHVVETVYVNLVALDSRDEKLEFIFNAKEMNTILSSLA